MNRLLLYLVVGMLLPGAITFAHGTGGGGAQPMSWPYHYCELDVPNQAIVSIRFNHWPWSTAIRHAERRTLLEKPGYFVRWDWNSQRVRIVVYAESVGGGGPMPTASKTCTAQH
jgi:hypothetical protein